LLPKAKLHFSRFEFKYVLPLRQREEVEAELLHFLELDPHVRRHEGSRYFVRSLYFDDPFFSAYHDKADGMHTRSKFRVRTYSADPAERTPWFLEIKGRYNNLVLKHRVPLAEPDGSVPDPHEPDLIGQILRLAPPGAVRSRFEYQLHRRRIRPGVLIDYWRRPYISKYDPGFRLTFDSELVATPTRALFPVHPTSRRVVPGYTVLEVKFNHRIPSWFHRVVQAFELRRRSFSKICHGTEVLGLAQDSA
jgi:hypothetical protein